MLVVRVAAANETGSDLELTLRGRDNGVPHGSGAHRGMRYLSCGLGAAPQTCRFKGGDPVSEFSTNSAGEVMPS